MIRQDELTQALRSASLPPAAVHFFMQVIILRNCGVGVAEGASHSRRKTISRPGTIQMPNIDCLAYQRYAARIDERFVKAPTAISNYAKLGRQYRCMQNFTTTILVISDGAEAAMSCHAGNHAPARGKPITGRKR